MGAFEEAIATAEAGVAIAGSRGQADANLAYALIGLGRPLPRQGRVAEALTVLERCLLVCRAMEHVHYLLVVAPALGAAYILDGRPEAAIDLLEPIRQTDEQLGMRNLHAFTLAVLSEALLITGANERAIGLARQSLEVALALRQRGFEAWSMRLLGMIAARQASSDPADAVDWFSKSLDLAEQCGMRPLAAHCHMALGMVRRNNDDPARANEHLAAGLALYRALNMRLWLADHDNVETGIDR
jgi:tetratricopeptide (TPR) repeat protein